MFPVEVFRKTLQKLTDILARDSIRFHLTGGITSAAYGEPRMTQDIDVVVDPKQLNEHLESVIAAFSSSDFLFHEASLRSAVREGGMFQLLDAEEALKLDVYPREMIPGELDRSVPLEVFEGVEIPVVSRPDAAASKLVWASKGSHKSRRDLRRIFQSSDAPVQSAIRRLAQELQLDGLLEEVLREPDQLP